MPFSSVYRRRAEEAVETLFSFRPLQPFVRDFVRRHGDGKINAGLNEERLRHEILQALVGEHFAGASIELTTLTDYTDELQESGHLHVFLLRLADAGELARLSDAGWLKGRLRERNLGDRFNQGYWIWQAREGPKLGGLWLDPGPRLRLKWVETRTWNAMQQGQQVVNVRRTVSFFHLDLETGDAELRIQKLHGNAQQLRREAFDSYLGLAGELLGCTGFETVSLAPTIRAALTARADERLRDDVEVVSMEVVPPEGGVWSGRADDVCPVHPRELADVLSLKYARQRTGHPAGKVTVTLDASLHEVQVFATCTPDDFDLLLQEVREAAWRHVVVDKPPLPPNEEPLFKRVGRLLGETTSGERSQQRRPLRRPDLHEARRKLAQAAQGSSLKRLYDYSEGIASRFQEFYNHEIERLRKDERVQFWLFLISIAIGLVIVAGGATAFLVFSAPVVGGVSTLVAALNAVFTVQLHAHQKRLAKRRRELDERLDDTQGLVQAIHSAEAIPDGDERAKKIVELATMLINRAA